MTGYYAQRLAGERLARCYAVAPPRVRRYLDAEVAHLLAHVGAADEVLELGCGHGRVAERIAAVAAHVVGIDLAEDSLDLARRRAAAAGIAPRCTYLRMDALALDFPADRFDVVACVQNGLCAFRVDRQALVREAWRVLRPGGVLLLSTYADAFWPDRLAWFERQAAEGLIGTVDREASRDGTIVCVDGFRAGRATADELRAIGAMLGAPARIDEVDGSSLWCELRKPESLAA